MKRLTTNRNSSLVRSLCAGPGGVRAAAVTKFFRAAAMPAGSRLLNFSPVPIIRKFPAALGALAGLRNASNKPHRNRMSTASRWRPPARKVASRHGPPGWPEQFLRSEFIGLQRSRQPSLSG
jgi:hypothetical protein